MKFFTPFLHFPLFVWYAEFGNPATIGCTLLIQFPIPTRVKWGWGKSLISSLSHIQSLQFNFYFADESQVFKIMLKKLVRVQLVFLII